MTALLVALGVSFTGSFVITSLRGDIANALAALPRVLAEAEDAAS